MSELNFFHLEILSFLKSKEVPSILPHSQDVSSSSLDEIVEDYRHLIGEPSSVHLERQWMNSFSEKEFSQSGLSAYFPKIYRGLPRVYHRNNPSESRIVKNFTNLSSLKKLTLEPALFSLYEPAATPSWMRISILAWIMPDGLGDWVAAVDTANILRAKWPNLDVQLFFVSSRPLPSSADFPVTYIPYENEPSQAVFSLPIKTLLRESDLILQIPTFFPQTRELFEQVRNLPSKHPVPLIENIGEYGFINSSWFHPKSHNRSMGLHALEKGIFVRKTNATSFSEIEDKNLLEWLFGTQLPGPEEINAYNQKCRFHLAYLTTLVGGAVYLHALLKMHERDAMDIDLCCPDLKWLIQWIEQRNSQQLPLLHESYGVKAIEIYALGGQHRKILGEKGKILRILNPGLLSHADVRKLFALSGEWVAVRGNQSFSEAVSAGKMFFYDGRNHNKYFIKDFLALAKNRLSGHSSALEAFRMIGQANLWNFSEEKGDWVDDSYFQKAEQMNWFDIAECLGNCLQDPDTIVGFKKFCSTATEEHSFNPFLCHLVQRLACHAKHPMIRQMEALQLNLYLHGAIPFPTLVNNLTKGISDGFSRSH
jgi:hypothetical protein